MTRLVILTVTAFTIFLIFTCQQPKKTPLTDIEHKISIPGRTDFLVVKVDSIGSHVSVPYANTKTSVKYSNKFNDTSEVLLHYPIDSGLNKVLTLGSNGQLKRVGTYDSLGKRATGEFVHFFPDGIVKEYFWLGLNPYEEFVFYIKFQQNGYKELYKGDVLLDYNTQNFDGNRKQFNIHLIPVPYYKYQIVVTEIENSAVINTKIISHCHSFIYTMVDTLNDIGLNIIATNKLHPEDTISQYFVLENQRKNASNLGY